MFIIGGRGLPCCPFVIVSSPHYCYVTVLMPFHLLMAVNCTVPVMLFTWVLHIRLRWSGVSLLLIDSVLPSPADGIVVVDAV